MWFYPPYIAVLLLAMGACKKKDDGPPANTAGVMFVNGVAGGSGNGELEARLNGTAINGANNIAFLAHSAYQFIASGSANISFVSKGLGTPLTSGTVSLTTNNRYSVFAGGTGSKPVFLAASDDLTAPASGAKIRFVNLSTDSLNANCFVNSLKVDSNRSYPSAGAFMQVAAGTATLLVQDPAKPTQLGQLAGVNLAAGKIYTVILTGLATGSGSNALKLTVVGNN